MEKLQLSIEVILGKTCEIYNARFQDDVFVYTRFSSLVHSILI